MARKSAPEIKVPRIPQFAIQAADPFPQFGPPECALLLDKIILPAIKQPIR